MPRIAIALLLLCSLQAHADDIVIIKSKRLQAGLTHSDIINIFMGKIRRLPSGQLVSAVSLQEGSAVGDQFNREFLKKTNAELDAYWAARILTGRVAPPRTVASEDEMRQQIENSDDGVGYISRSKAGSGVDIISVDN